jgi:hypothetical protein
MEQYVSLLTTDHTTRRHNVDHDTELSCIIIIIIIIISLTLIKKLSFFACLFIQNEVFVWGLLNKNLCYSYSDMCYMSRPSSRPNR